MKYLKKICKYEPLYGARILREDGKERVMLAMIYDDSNNNDEKSGWFSTIDNDSIDKKKRTHILNSFTPMVAYEKENMIGWMHENSYILISESEYKKYKEDIQYPWKFHEIVKEIKIKSGSKKNIENDNVGTTPLPQGELVSHIIMYANKSKDYFNFLNLYNKYKELGLVAVYNAVTESGSVNVNSVKNGRLKCSAEQVKRASAILDYESKFMNMVNQINGRRDYVYIALAFCFNHPDVDNDRLYEMFKKRFKKIGHVKTLKDAANNIEFIYNSYYKNKVDIEYEFTKVHLGKHR